MHAAEMIAKFQHKISDFFAAVARTFTPPFYGLPLIMGCYFVFSYFGLTHNPIWMGDLPDPDDYTYLSQTLDWLQGQGWYDNTQHRMSPPEGVPIHYTRVAELPIAGMILLFRAFHYSWQGSAMLGALLLPIIYLGFLFAALRWTMARLGSPDWARLSSFIALFASAYLFKFAPGQIDHHGIEGVLIVFAIGLTTQIFAQPERLIWAAGVGFILAFANGIALETLPWLALVSAIIGLWAVAVGAKAKRATQIFAASLFLSSIALLALQKPPSEFFQSDILAYSITYVYLAAAIAASLLAAAEATRIANIKVRFVASGIVAAGLGVLYLHHYPALLGGPYGAMDLTLAKLFFSNLEEAQSLIERYTLYQGLLRLGTPLIGLIASLFFTYRAKGDKKWAWGLVSILLAAAIALAIFYQVRVMLYALLFAVLPLTHMVERGWVWIGARYAGRQKFWAEITLILLVGPLTAVFLPALQDGRSFNTGVLLFPAQTFDDSCGLRGLEKILDAPEYVARAPLRIINMMDAGPELLFRTPHAVISAPYHTNVRGNLDALDFFSTVDYSKAKAITERDGINLVVMCRNIPDMYLAGPAPHYVMFPNGEMHMRPDPSLAGQLAFHKVPEWLTEIPVPFSSNYLLFAVK